MNNWRDYEHFIVKYHQDTYNQESYHWSNIPEELLYKAGFINDTNKIRLQRKRDQEDGKVNSIQEYGLDGISKESEDLYHGLQAKCYDKNSYLRASDLGTFLSVLFLRMKSKNAQSKGYLYHACKLESNLRDDICVNNQCDIIARTLLYDQRVNNQSDRSMKCEECEELRYYQVEAIEKLKNIWNMNEVKSMPQLIQMPCGTGKSTVMSHYLKKCDYDHIYIFSPLRVHAKQNLENMGKYLHDYEKILVDCDKDGTRNIVEIEEKLHKKCVISSTYSSALDIISKIVENKKYENKKSILIVDEAHNVYDELIKVIEMFEKVILLTATPSVELKEIVHCNVLYEYKMDQAIKDKYICDYRIYLPYLESTYDIPIEFSKYNKEFVAKVMYLINGMLMKGCRRAIVYLKTVEECILFNEIFEDVMKNYHALPYWCERINRDTSDKERSRILKDFESEKERNDAIHILSSVRILDEGVDIVKCDSIFMCGGNRSGNEIRTLQRMCRSNRLDRNNPNKISHCFMWCDEWNESLVLLHNMKELDVEFSKKVSIVNVDYNTNCNKSIKEGVDISNAKIKEFIMIKCVDIAHRQMDRAIQIVKRAKEREEKGLNLLPKSHSNWKSKSEEVQQEHRDNQVMEDWRKCINGQSDFILSVEVKVYLDKELNGWSNVINYEEEAYKQALEIIDRLKIDENGNKIFPKRCYKDNKTAEELQETKDAQKLSYWSRALRKDELNSTQNRAICYPKVKELLDKELPGWYIVESVEEIHIKRCKELIENSKKRVSQGLNNYPIKKMLNGINDNEENKKENEDYIWITKWRKAYINLKNNNEYFILSSGKKEYYICPDKVVEMLNAQFPNWNIENKDELEELEKVKKIVERCYKRKEENKTLLPKFKNNIPINERSEEEKEEHSDANKLSMIRKAYNQYLTGVVKEKERHYTYYESVIEYLDEHISGWNQEKKMEEDKDKENLQMKEIMELINRCNKRKENGSNFLPKSRSNKSVSELSEDEKIEGYDSDKLLLYMNGKRFLYENVKKYLDDNLEGWNEKKIPNKIVNKNSDKKEEIQLNEIKNIVERAMLRNSKGLNKYPRSKINKQQKEGEIDEIYNKRIEDEIQQSRDYDKLSKMKNNKIEVFESVIEYLNANLPEWKK